MCENDPNNAYRANRTIQLHGPWFQQIVDRADGVARVKAMTDADLRIELRKRGR